jgi:hypothetical protein
MKRNTMIAGEEMATAIWKKMTNLAISVIDNCVKEGKLS